MNAQLPCLTPEVMLQYLDAQLSKALDEQVESHLHECNKCVKAMLVLADADSFFQVVAASSGFDQELTASAGRVTALVAKLETLRKSGFLNGPATTIDNRQQVDTDPFTTISVELLTPSRSRDELGWIGTLRVKAQIGHGGMGVVYRGEDTILKRDVAIKAILPKYAHNAQHRQRFIREARSIAAVPHNNIVAIYQVGENNGYPFIVMPFLQGQSLQDRLRPTEALPIPEVVGIGKQVARGLAAAHERGLIHRDIKPSNIWLEPGPHGTVKILDFGLARLPEMLLEPSDDKTQDGMVLGTPAFLSPEQARGKPIDQRTDLYSLGVVLYRLATGHLPFASANAQGYLVAHASEIPKDADLRNPAVPPRLAKIIKQLIEKDPARRPQSAQAVANALDELIAGGQKSLLPTRRQIVSLAVAAIVLLTFLGAWQLWPRSNFSGGSGAAPPLQQTIVTTVLRQGARPVFIQSAKELASLAPLRTGDELELSLEVPKGAKAGLFMVDTAGQLRELTQVQVTAAGDFDRVRFPVPGVWKVLGPPGTVIFLACANQHTKPLLEDWQTLLKQANDKPGPLPAPKEDVVFLLTRDDVLAFGDVSREVIETPYSKLRDQLQRLRAAATGKFDYFWGAALPVR